MSRLFPGRRPSTNFSSVLKKSSHRHQEAPQSPNKGDPTNVATSAPQQPEAPSPLAPFIGKILETQVSVLVQRLEGKLSCNSGLPFSAVKDDQIIAVDGLVKLTASSIDYIVWRLCSILKKLQKRAFPDGTRPEEVLDSQLFILKTLVQILTARRSAPPSTLEDDFSFRLSSPPICVSSYLSSSPTLPLSPESTRPRQVHGPNLSILPSSDSAHSMSTSTLLSDYPPLDDNTVRYALWVLRTVERYPSNNPGAGTKDIDTWRAPEWDPILNASALVHGGRKKSVHGVITVTEVQTQSERDNEPNQSTREVGTWPPLPGSQYPVYAHDETLHRSFFVDVMVLIRRFTNLVIYHLSVSNWPVMFDRLKTRLHALIDGDSTPSFLPPPSPSSFPYLSRSIDSKDKSQPVIGDTAKNTITNGPDGNVADEGDLNLLSACAMDRTRLMAVFQVFLSTFREMPVASQCAASLALRDAILNWANNFPDQFTELWTTHTLASFPQPVSVSSASAVPDKDFFTSLSGSVLTSSAIERVKTRELDGLAGLVFDMLSDSTGDGNQQVVVLYPTLAALLCISPARLDSAYRANEGTVKLSSKSNLLATLMHSLTSSTTSKMAMSEHSIFACFEIARFAFFIPPPSSGEEGRSLWTIGVNVALELKNFLVCPGIPRVPFYASKDPINVDFFAYCIATIFRFHPEEALKYLIQVCLEPERSLAVKLSVVKALVLLVVEIPKYSWQPSLESIFPVVTPRIRRILKSCATYHPEVINGIRCPAVTFPSCKTVAAPKSGESSVANGLDETLRLRVQIETLLPLEPRFWLYNTTDADHSFLVNDMRLEQHRDKRERAATVMALSATITCSLNIPPGAPCYEEGMRYLLIIFPPALVNAALLIIHAIDDHEFLRMAINMLHTMLSQLTSDTFHEPWRSSPHIVEAISLMQYASWCCVTSSRIDIVTTAQRCIRLLSTIERNPDLPLSPRFSEADFGQRVALLERLGGQDLVIGGRVAIQKRIRQLVAMAPSPAPVHVMIFYETMARFLKLSRQVEHSSQNQRKDHSPGKASTDHLHEWENIMYMMAVTGRELVDEKEVVFPEHIILLLPPSSRGWRRHDTVNQFIQEVLRLLCSEDLMIRKSAKEALGIELNFKLIPTLFKHLDFAIQKQLVDLQEDVLHSTLLFAEQCLMVMKMTFERMETTVLDSDVPGNCISIGLFINRLPANIRTIRLRALYSSTVDMFLIKRHYFAISQENQFRNRIVDIMVDWIEPLDVCFDDSRLSDSRGAASAAQVAALKLFVHFAETLHVQVPQTATNTDSMQIIPRDHNRYLVTLMNVVVPAKEHSDVSSDFDRASKSTDSLHNEALVHELVISGIANLLKNNSELYRRYCLERCYDADIRLRVMFMKAFTRVVHLGTQFDQGQPRMLTNNLHTLCEMVRDCKMISLSVIKVCPPNEVEAVISVLMRVFNTRHALLDFLKTLIDREVSSTDSPAQLFRSNTICNRMLSAFARKYGYVYLRSTLESLVHQMTQVPHGCSFELDPSKLPATEDATRNAQALMVISQAFVDVIVESVPYIPSVIREICHHIAEVVSSNWPKSKYHAIGAFMFLRFICPAIVSPSIVDIEISEISTPGRSASIHRGLLLVAKIITNLSNNVVFGKEAYLTALNPFLERNVRTVAKFLSDTHTLTDTFEDDDEILDSGCDDTDSLVLHQFFQSHADKIEKELLAELDDNTGDSGSCSNGKEAWDMLCSTLMDMKPALQSPTLSHEDAAHHIHYQQFMRRNHDRNTDVFRDVFSSESDVDGHVFVLKLANINIDIVDFELLLYTIFKAVVSPVGKGHEFDIIFDFTSFTARSRPPNAWLQLGLELLPRDIRGNWRSAYLLNISSDAYSFLRNVFHLFSGFHIARKVTAVSSVTELRGHFPRYSTLMASSYPASLESSEIVFNQIHMQTENRCWTSIVLHVGNNCLRIINVKAQELSSTLSTRSVDLIYLHDVDDIYRPQERRLVLRRSRRGPSVMFDYSDCEVLLKAIQAGKQRSVATQQVHLLPASQTSDSRAIFLAVGLLHACHNDEYVRGAAYDLLTADCIWLNYPFDAEIPWRGSFIPINPLAFIMNFSERISAFAPEMTLDFILQWSVGFMNSSTVEKSICLQYVSPWIRNLSIFMDPSNTHFDEPRVRNCIRLFINMTIQEPELYTWLQRAIWLEIGKLPPAVLNVVIDQLIRVAIDSESDSRRCEVVGDTLIPISTIHSRAKVIKELRTIISRAYGTSAGSLLETDEWKSITVLSRLVLVAGHTPRLATQNQLYAAEIAHLVTMLAGTGLLTMRLSIYGIAVNLLQALHVAQSDHEVVVMQLRQMLEDLKTRHSLQLFGLDRHYPSSAISMFRSASTPISVDSLEQITEMLLRALELGSRSVGLSNVWKARWMSLVSSLAFQASFSGQLRSFTILSKFTDSKIEDEALSQMLLVLKRNISSSLQGDSQKASAATSPQDDSQKASAALLRCVRMAVPGLPSGSQYLGSIFWLAVSIIQIEQPLLYPEALQLLLATIQTMEGYGMFVAAPTPKNPMVAVLMDARAPLLRAVAKLDELSGLSFETDFGFSLTTILWDGVVDAHFNLLIAVLTSLLEMSIRAANPTAERRHCLDAASMPLFLALSTTMDPEAYGRLLEEVCHVSTLDQSAPHYGHGDTVRDSAVELEPLGLTDMKGVLLTITSLLCLEISPLIKPTRKENIHFLWADFANVYPELFVSGIKTLISFMTQEQLSHQTDALFSPSLSETHLQVVFSTYEIIMSKSSEPAPTGSSDSSSTSCARDVNSAPTFEVHEGNKYMEMLSKVGMSGMVQPFKRWQGHKTDPKKVKEMTACTADLVHLILSQRSVIVDSAVDFRS